MNRTSPGTFTQTLYKEQSNAIDQLKLKANHENESMYMYILYFGIYFEVDRRNEVYLIHRNSVKQGQKKNSIIMSNRVETTLFYIVYGPVNHFTNSRQQKRSVNTIHI